MTKQVAETAELDEDGQPTDDRPFDPFRVPKSEAARALVADVLNQLQNYEEHLGLRKRARRAVDQGRFEAAVGAVVCDLIHRHLTEPDGWLSVSLSNDDLVRTGRYGSPAATKVLPTIIERMAAPEMAFLVLEKGTRARFGPARRTVIKAGPRLVSRVRERRIALEDLGRSASEEIIVLRREKTDRWDAGGEQEYKETPVTVRLRQQLTAINDWLDEADLFFDGDVEREVDTTDRRLRRYFTRGSFESGGRLFGGFWQQLSKRHRREGLLVEGEPVTTLDFGQMGPRILYGLAGVHPEWTDAYAVSGLTSHREGVKKVFNALLFADQRPKRFPQGTRHLFPARVTIEHVVAALEDMHKPIATQFFTGIGHRVMFVESEILVDVLVRLKELNVVALPVHDAIIVRRSEREQAREVMLEVFAERTGVEGLVREEEEG